MPLITWVRAAVDAEREAAAARRQTLVEPAEVSLAAEAKAASKRTPNELPVQSLSTLLAHLASLTLNEVALPGNGRYAFPLLAEPTPLQKEALALLEVDLPKSVSSKVTGRKSSSSPRCYAGDRTTDQASGHECGSATESEGGTGAAND